MRTSAEAGWSEMKAWERRVEDPVDTMIGGKGIIIRRICCESSVRAVRRISVVDDTIMC